MRGWLSVLCRMPRRIIAALSAASAHDTLLAGYRGKHQSFDALDARVLGGLHQLPRAGAALADATAGNGGGVPRRAVAGVWMYGDGSTCASRRSSTLEHVTRLQSIREPAHSCRTHLGCNHYRLRMDGGTLESIAPQRSTPGLPNSLRRSSRSIGEGTGALARGGALRREVSGWRQGPRLVNSAQRARFQPMRSVVQSWLVGGTEGGRPRRVLPCDILPSNGL